MKENLNTAKELSGETVTIDYAGLNVEIPVEYANDPVLKEQALAKVRNSSDFDEIKQNEMSDTVTVNYMGGSFITNETNLQNPEVMKKLNEDYRNSSDFDEIINKTTGASTFVRTLAPPSSSFEDRLATIKKYYS